LVEVWYKPLALVCRAILASTQKGAIILDPFAGSSTTGIAANMLGRSYVGIEQEIEYLEISKARRQLLDDKREEWSKKIPDLGIHRMADA
jgi:site-specific DNA-methyltransferase (adenine-specific)